MSKDVVDNVSVIEIKPGDTCVFTVSISFKKEYVFVRSELDDFLHAKVREFFKRKDL